MLEQVHEILNGWLFAAVLRLLSETRWPEVLTMLFTGLTFWVAWKAIRQQERNQKPAIFLEIDEFRNTYGISIRIRNRENHDIKVFKIEVYSPKYCYILASHVSMNEYVTPFDEAWTRVTYPDLTLGAITSGYTEGMRPYILGSDRAKPFTLKLAIRIDPSDGISPKYTLMRKVQINSEIAKTIHRFKREAAAPAIDSNGPSRP